MTANPQLTIGKVAALVGMKPTTIRYYEARGLVAHPSRKPRLFGVGYRVYAEQHLQRLRFITQARRLGFTLAEIKLLVSGSADSSPKRRQRFQQLISERLPQIDKRITELEEVRSTLRRLQARLSLPIVEQGRCCDPLCGPETCG
jgi:MerR family Zn(II)-responsive transcriptional regulator of zntA